MFGNLMQLGEAVVKIKADDELFLKQVQKLDSMFVAMGNNANGAMKGVALGMRVVASGAGVAAALAGSAMVIAARMTNHWNELQKSVGATTAQMRTLREEVYKIAEKTPSLGLSGAADLAAAVGKMGVGAGMMPDAQAGAVAKFTKDLAGLKPALDMPLEHFAKEVLYLQRVMGLGKNDIESFASALAGLDKASRASQGEILETTKALAPAFQELGASIQDLLPFAAQIAEVDAGPMVMTRLLDNMVHDVRKYATYAHLDVEKFSQYLETRPVQAVQTWIKAFGKLDDKSKFWLARDLGINKRMLDRFLAISHSGGGPDFGGIARKEWMGKGSTQQARDLDKQRFGATLEEIYDHIERIGDAIGRAMLPGMKAVADRLREWAAWFEVNEPIVESFFDGLRSGFANICDFIVKAWRVVSDAWESGLVGAVTQFGNLGTVMTAFWKHSGELAAAFWDAAVELFKGMAGVATWVGRASVPVALNIATVFKDAFQTAAEWGYETFKRLFAWIDKQGSDATRWLTNPLGAALKNHDDKTSFKDIFNHSFDIKGRLAREKFMGVPAFDEGGKLSEGFAAALGRNRDAWSKVGGEIGGGITTALEKMAAIKKARDEAEAKARGEAEAKAKIDALKKEPGGNRRLDAKGFGGDILELARGTDPRRRGGREGYGLYEMSMLMNSGFEFGKRLSFEDLHSSSSTGTVNPILAAISDGKKATQEQTAATREQTEQMKKGIPVRVAK